MNLPDRIIELSEKATTGPWIATVDDMVVTESRYLVCEMSWPSCEAEPSPEFKLIAEYRTLAPRLAEWARRAEDLLLMVAQGDPKTGSMLYFNERDVGEARTLLKELEVDDDQA